MIAKPEVSVSAGEPHADTHGQSWSPARVTMTWPGVSRLPGPSVDVSVIAAIREQMTVEQLRKAHLQAAHDVLTAALLSLEEIPEPDRKAGAKAPAEKRARRKAG
jgi:hypothetical protein